MPDDFSLDPSDLEPADEPAKKPGQPDAQRAAQAPHSARGADDGPVVLGADMEADGFAATIAEMDAPSAEMLASVRARSASTPGAAPALDVASASVGASEPGQAPRGARRSLAPTISEIQAVRPEDYQAWRAKQEAATREPGSGQRSLALMLFAIIVFLGMVAVALMLLI